jgi:hypothetical protein
LEGSSPILNHALRIVEVLGAYRSVILCEIPLLISLSYSSFYFEKTQRSFRFISLKYSVLSFDFV